MIFIKDTIKNAVSFCLRMAIKLFNIETTALTAGVGYHSSYIKTGEEFLIKDILRPMIKHSEPVMLDIGANIGNYSNLLLKHFPSARLYCFEPNPYSFTKLAERLGKSAVVVRNQAVGDHKGQAILYVSSKDPENELSSMSEDVFSDIHKTREYEKISVNIDTLDHIMKELGIVSIDFLKIDVEGHEIEVLRGAAQALNEGRIQAIQFEFNEMNTVTRTFMKDFFDILPQYSLFRLNRKSLIPLREYSTALEIFQYQNIVAINRKISASS